MSAGRIVPGNTDEGVVVPDRYVRGTASMQNAVDIFRDGWTSHLPPEADAVSGGGMPLFSDSRMVWFLERLRGEDGTGLEGKRVAELGPFEGGHSYMILNAGAGSLVGVEGNTFNYLKTLVVKEGLRLDRMRVECVEIESWLQDHSVRFDAMVASGVLYHLASPLLALYNMAQRADALCLWTHYVDEEVCGFGDPRMGPLTGQRRRLNVRGFEAEGFQRSYGGNHLNRTFCGGAGADSVWMRGADIVSALRQWGFDVEVGLEEPDHEHGPAAAFFARRRRRKIVL